LNGSRLKVIEPADDLAASSVRKGSIHASSMEALEYYGARGAKDSGLELLAGRWTVKPCYGEVLAQGA
jgi:hypothetical protein